MIRGYYRIPRFDDGMNFAADKMAGYNNYQYVDDPNIDQSTLAAVPQPDIDSWAKAQLASYLDGIKPISSDTQSRQTSRNTIRTTTAVEDKKVAKQVYNSAIKKADQKAKKEVAAAKAKIKEANKDLKRNGVPLITYKADQITNTGSRKSLYGDTVLPELIVTGHRIQKPNSQAAPKNSNYTSKAVVRSGGVGSYRSARTLSAKDKKGTPGGMITAAFEKFMNFLTQRPNRQKNNSINGINYNRSILK